MHVFDVELPLCYDLKDLKYWNRLLGVAFGKEILNASKSYKYYTLVSWHAK
jgi:hypothetical protein